MINVYIIVGDQNDGQQNRMT